MVNKKKFKIISIITILFVISTLISLKSLNVKATGTNSKPNFTITDLNASPNPAKVGEDILVSGKIVPGDFETSTQPKEIVLVLDVSGSMNDKIILEEKCTEERGTNWVWDVWPLRGHYEYDYCNSHKRSGEHNKTISSTKISELKKAAKSFVETMKDIPNLKIGIIKYATDATIASDLKSANDSSLITSINNLNANGGTNIREGLRKATYLLNKISSNANKTVVLMTDGNPTYYSKYDILDDTKPKVYGTGNSTNDETMTYTKKLAKDQIGTRQYNAYSIGYGLDSSGTKYLKQIHASMKNLTDNTDVNEENGFFAKSDGSITEIFNQIAENIKNSYELKDISLDINLNQSFTLNIGGNEVKVGNIVYNKKSENKSTGKIIYHADPINFSFLVKGSQIGQAQSILNNIDINFLFENQNLTVSSNADVKVDIISNELPNISAKLISEKAIEITKDQEITLNYEITPDDFIYNNSGNSGNVDVVVIVELGKKQGNLDGLKNGIKNKLTDPFQTEKKAKFSFITFNKDQTKKENSLKSFENSNNYYHDIRLTVDNLKESSIFESSTKNIDEALNDAYEELEINSRPIATKNIVVIANNDITYSKTVANNIKSKGYNIVTLSLESENLNKNLYKMHSDLGGKADSIFNINNDYNNINNSKMDLVREKIVAYAAAKPYEFKPVINLNIGSDFEPVSGIVRSNASGKENIGIIEIPTITYNLTQNNKYHADSKIIEVKLKANNIKPAIYNFGKQSDNVMIYQSIINNTVIKYIETPAITVKEEVKNLIHGLYNGIIDKEVNIQENDNKAFELAQGSTVTFGSEFTLSGNSVNFELNVDDNFQSMDTNDIKIYKITKDTLENSKLEILNGDIDIKNNGLNDFDVSIKNINIGNETEEIDILVVYQGHLKENLNSLQEIKNDIIFSNLSKDVKIITPESYDGSPSLPDLF